MRTLRRIGAGLVAMVLIIGLASPAQAAVRVVRDPKGDAPFARYDMTRIRCANGDHRLSIRVKATDELRRGQGYLSFYFSPSHDFDYYLEAISRRTDEGKLRNRLILTSSAGATRLRCAVKGGEQQVA